MTAVSSIDRSWKQKIIIYAVLRRFALHDTILRSFGLDEPCKSAHGNGMIPAPIILSMHMPVDFSTGIGGVEVAGAVAGAAVQPLLSS